MNSIQDATTRRQTWLLFGISVAGLFWEMLLIRWIGTEIRIFAYLQNTILVVCFLGLGTGCFTSRSAVKTPLLVGCVAILSLILGLPGPRGVAARITNFLSVFDDLLIWQKASAAGLGDALRQVSAGLAMTLLLMWVVWLIFLYQGRILGRLFDQHPHVLVAYSSNVAGSLVGIWLFVLISSLSSPPYLWLAVGSVLLLPFVGTGRTRVINLALLILAVGLTAWGYRRSEGSVVWSPYQKLELIKFSGKITATQPWAGDYLILVNNIGYQGLFDLRPERLARDNLVPVAERGFSQYDLPLRFKPQPRNVLVVGAGAGNDVAGALRGGAQRVTAVEIDPAIIRLGRRFHPERPYDSAKVTLINDDARAFFASTNERFDLIIFGLLDSHTTTAMTNARLDHYVYTVESLARARSLLSEDGVMALSFEARQDFLADRMAGTLRSAFGQRPLIFAVPPSHTGWGGVMFVSGNAKTIAESLRRDPDLIARVGRWEMDLNRKMPYATPLATDDWPYIYLQYPRIPALFFFLAALLIAFGFAVAKFDSSPWLREWDQTNWHFFLLGAAFMLLEVQNISKASVVLGNTWQVNAVIITGILAMILAANILAMWYPRTCRYAPWLLLGTCLALYFFDLARLASLPYAARACLAGTLTTLPMLFSGLLFADSFRRVEHRDAALGANLFGALAGGVLQSISFLTGIKTLLLIVSFFYLLAILLRPRSEMQSSLAAAPTKSHRARGRGKRKSHD